MHTLKIELNQFTSEKLISDKELVDVRSQLAAALKVLCTCDSTITSMLCIYSLSLSTLHLSIFLFSSLSFIFMRDKKIII